MNFKDDGTNRTLLNWLKLWDKVVFNRELAKKPVKVTEATTANAGGGGAGDAGNNEFKKTYTSNNDLIEELDDTGRPQQKT